MPSYFALENPLGPGKAVLSQVAAIGTTHSGNSIDFEIMAYAAVNFLRQ